MNPQEWQDIEKELRGGEVLIVHFSTSPKMSNTHPAEYPQDLTDVIKNPTWNVSAATVRPGMSLSALPGEIGLILFPTFCTSIEKACACDAGSSGDGRVRTGLGSPLKLEELHARLGDDKAYTEWFILDHHVKGVFYIPHGQVHRRQVQPRYFSDNLTQEEMDDLLPSLPGTLTGYELITAQQVQADFPTLSIFSMLGHQFVRWDRGAWTPVDYNQIVCAESIS